MNYTGGNMDERNNESKKSPLGFYMLRGVGIALLLWLIKTLMSLFVMMVYTTSAGNTDFVPMWAIYLIIAVGDLFIFNSLVRIFSLHDRAEMRKFLDRKIPNVRFGEEISALVHSREFLTETCTSLITVMLISFIGGFNEISGIFRDTGAPQMLLFFLPAIMLVPMLFIVGTWSQYEVRRRWHYLDHVQNLEILYSIPRLIINGVLIFFLYIFVFPYAPIILLAYISIVGVFAALIDMLTVLGFIAAAIVLVLLIFGYVALRSIFLRKKLLKQLKAVSASSGYTLSEIKRPYASLFKWRSECNFAISDGKRTFSCRLLGSYWQRAPMYFTSDKHGHYLHRIGTKNHHIDLLSQFEYDFEGEGDKLIILNPVPRRLYAAQGTYIEHPWYDENKMISVIRGSRSAKAGGHRMSHDGDVRKLEPGDKIRGYAVYNTTSFIGAIDRKCLGRYNGMFE